jgi:hypothetical protein
MWEAGRKLNSIIVCLAERRATANIQQCKQESEYMLHTEYDIALLHLVSFYYFVAKACARRPGAATSVERRRCERRTLLAAGAAGKLAGATRLR